MPDKRDQDQRQDKDQDERVAIPLDPEDALSGLLEVDPGSDSVHHASSEEDADQRP